MSYNTEHNSQRHSQQEFTLTEFIKDNFNKGYVTNTKRIRKKPQRFGEQTFIPGSNNSHTVGRTIDPYDRKYDMDDFFME